MNTRKIVFPEDFKTIRKEIADMKAKMPIAAKRIVKELSEYGLEDMKKTYNSYEFKGSHPSTFYMEGTDTEKKLVMQGPQAIYDEFGTGTLGEISPHPIKEEFNLNGYNTGRTIRPANKYDVRRAAEQGVNIQLGHLFWTYKTEDGQKIYTKGTPAQQEVYDAMNKTHSKAPEVIKKVMKEVVFND